MTTSTTPNTYCVILGVPGTDPLTIVGPFATMDDATAHATEHEQKGQKAIADLLLAPENCP